MRVEANAKVNLSLEVYGRRADGYHELRSVVMPIELADIIEIEPSADGSIRSDTGYGERDLAVRAAHALRVACADAPGAQIGARMHVEKRIPVGGGLGGGSADAAAVLRALNGFWELGLSPDELAAVGAAVGSDVPALVLVQHFGAPVLMEGRGEHVRLLSADERGALPLPPNKSWIVLAGPGTASSTAEVYARCAPRAGAPGPFDASASFVNDLQAPACELHPEIADALAALAEAGADGVAMSGSGSTVFGFAGERAVASRIAAVVESTGCQAWVTRPLARQGIPSHS